MRRLVVSSEVRRPWRCLFCILFSNYITNMHPQNVYWILYFDAGYAVQYRITFSVKLDDVLCRVCAIMNNSAMHLRCNDVAML